MSEKELEKMKDGDVKYFLQAKVAYEKSDDVACIACFEKINGFEFLLKPFNASKYVDLAFSLNKTRGKYALDLLSSVLKVAGGRGDLNIHKHIESLTHAKYLVAGAK